MSNRRDLLQGIGAAAAALPLLAGTRRAAAQVAGPRRFLFVFSPNATIYPSWVPSGTETQWTLSPILAPLQRHKQDLVVVDGLKNAASYVGPGDPHGRG